MFSRQDLVHAYLAAQQRGYGGYYAESTAYNEALKAHHEAMLEALQRLFDVRLRDNDIHRSDNPALRILFRATADSLFAIRTPWSDFLEAGLIHQKLEAAGADGERARQASDSISELAAEARKAHLDMLDALAAILLQERAELTFTEADLQAAGVSASEPDPADYPMYEG